MRKLLTIAAILLLTACNPRELTTGITNHVTVDGHRIAVTYRGNKQYDAVGRRG